MSTDQPAMPVTRIEYRICGERDGYGAWEGSPDTRDLRSVEREAAELQKRNRNLRIQRRTVTTTGWETIADV